jgi:hypothetical protein
VLYLQLASQGKIKWLKKWPAGTGSAVVYCRKAFMPGAVLYRFLGFSTISFEFSATFSATATVDGFSGHSLASTRVWCNRMSVRFWRERAGCRSR